MGLTEWGAERRADEDELFPHLSRVTGLPPLVAQAAFDGVRRERCRPGDPARWDVTVPGGRLELHGDGRVAPPPRPGYWSYRDVPGLIRSRWGRVVPVRVELLPWSDVRTALTLTVRGPRSGVSTGAYRRIGDAALDVLSGDLEAWPFREPHDVDPSRGLALPLTSEWT